MRYRNDESVQNISYINKDFPSIWQELLELIPKLTNKWNPAEANESDPLAVLLKLLAIYNDKFNYNCDKRVLEAFPSSLTQLRSAYNVYDTIGYNPSWYKSALTRITFTYNNQVEFDSASFDKVVIPKLTPITDADNSIVYTTLEDIVIRKDDNLPIGYTFSVLAIQGNVMDYDINGVDVVTVQNLTEDNKLYFSERAVAQNGVFISSTPEFQQGYEELNILLGEWRKVDNIYQVSSTEKAYKFGIDPITESCYLQFPESMANLIGSGLYIKYTRTEGLSGNIKSNTLSTFYDSEAKMVAYLGDNIVTDVGETSLNPRDYLVINNLEATSNGADPETIDEMYKNYQRVKNVFDTLVTLLDYENYLYQYTTAAGENIVSNIRAADRTNDMYDTYRVKTLDLSGNHEVLHINQDDEHDVISAYDIRFYPLQATPSVDTDKAFKDTFNYANDSNTLINIGNAVIGVKVLNHNYLNSGKPILVDYDLDGDIYLTEKVSKQVAIQILDKVKASLRELLNARKMTFGMPVSYKEVVDTIQNSDSRIEYVALKPIEYTGEVNVSQANSSGSEPLISNTTINNTTVINRNIWSGALPWTDYDTTFDYNINQETETTGTATTDVTFSSYVTVDDLSATKFKLAKNEKLSLLSPLYNEGTIYSNYLYFRTKNITLPINKDDLYTLSGNAEIIFYETRDAYDSDSAGAGNNCIAKLTAGTIVKFNFDYTNPQTQTSLNQGKTISVMKKAAGELTSPNTNIKFFTNSEKLLTSIPYSNPNTDIPYTLGLGEYFIYRVGNSSSFTLLGEGTSLIIKHNSADSTKNLYFKSEQLRTEYINKVKDISVNWENVSEGISSSTNPFSSLWLPQTEYTANNNLDGSQIEYQINQILTFSEGYEFGYFTGSDTSPSLSFNDSSIEWFDSNKSQPNQTFSTSPVGTYILKYKLAEDVDWVDLPSIPTDEKWEGLLRFEINSSKDNPAELDYVAGSDYVTHIQTVSIGGVELTKPNSTTPILYLEMNPQVVNAGIDLTLYGATTPQNYRIYSIDDNYVVSDLFTTIESDNNEVSYTNEIAPDNTYVTLIPFIVSNPSATTTVKINSRTSISVAAGNNSTYYACLEKDSVLTFTSTNTFGVNLGKPVNVLKTKAFGVDKYTTAADSISSLADTFLSNDPSSLDTDFESQFDYTYIPNDEELIDINNPLSGESFLNKNNIFNRYALPRLNQNTLFSNLRISALSIK